MKLISEAIENVEYICEESDGDKSYKIRGIFMQGDIKNRNGRVYPMDVLTKEVKNYNNKFVNEKRAYGELGHPDGPTVNLERVSHLVTELYPDGKNIIGEARILDTPMGKIVKTLMDEGTKLGVSYVRSDFYLAAAADIVADPSAPSAFVQGIMEGKEWVWNHGSLIEAHVSEIKRSFDVKKRQRQANEAALAFAKFLKKL